MVWSKFIACKKESGESERASERESEEEKERETERERAR